MSQTPHCPKCGAELPGDAMDGLCPKCMGQVVFGGSEAAGTKPEEQPAGTLRMEPEAGTTVERAGMRIGRYKLLEQIGEGGFGVVYMAEQVEPVQRKVALKVIKAGMDTKEVIARFEAERQALALMDHPNIARILDAGVTGASDSQPSTLNSQLSAGRPYFVMELVKGIPLTEFCDLKKLAPTERLELFVQVCQAVQHAHQKGIIHRDLKPSNVLVTLHDGTPVPKVIDFGIAKALGPKLTEKTLFTGFAHLLGTPAYMSPEQAELSGLDIDTRSDIYSLGVLLYELLTGVTPFDKEALAKAALDEVRRMVRETEPPKPSTRLRGLGEKLTEVAARRHMEPPKLIHQVRGDLDWIVMKCLEKDRKRRYETANGLAMDVGRHLKCEPVVAAAPSLAYRLQKFMRRHRGPVAAALVVTFILVLGVVVSAWQWRKALEAGRREAYQRRQAEHRAIAEALAKDEANRERSRAEAAFTYLQIQRAGDLFASDDAGSALASLADVLRREPTNRVAAEQLLFALTYRSFPLQLAEPIRFVAGGEGKLRLSPDGCRIATVSAEGKARLWDALTGRPLCDEFPNEPEEPVGSVLFSRDGNRLLTISARTSKLEKEYRHGARVFPNGISVRLWDARTGQSLTEPMRHPADGLSPLGALFSPDGRRLLTTSGGRRFLAASSSVWLWDALTGRPSPGQLVHETNTRIHSAIFSPDSERVFTASSRSIRLWNARTGEPLTALVKTDALPRSFPHRIRDRTDPWPVFHSAEFSPDGNLVVALFGGACVWNGYTGEALTGGLRRATDGPLRSVKFSPDGQRVLTVAANAVRLWDVNPNGLSLAEGPCITGFGGKESHNSLQPISRATETTAAQQYFDSAEFSLDGDEVLTISSGVASKFSTVRLWDSRTGQNIGVRTGYENRALRAQGTPFRPYGRWEVETDSFSPLLWDENLGRPLCSLLEHEGLETIQFSRDGRRLLKHEDDTSLRVWDAHTGRPETEPLKTGGAMLSPDLSPDGKRVVSVTPQPGGYVAHIWEIGHQARPQLPGKALSNTRFRFSADRSLMLWALPNAFRVWDVRTGQPLTELVRTIPPGQSGGGLRSAEFSLDAGEVLTVSWYDKKEHLQVWDARAGHPLGAPIGLEAAHRAVRLSPDGRRLSAVLRGTNELRYRAWDVKTSMAQTDLLLRQGGEGSFAFRGAISANGRRVLVVEKPSGCIGLIWEIQGAGPPAGPITFECGEWVNFAEFGPDEQRVVIASGTFWDFSARVFDARTGQALTGPLKHDLPVKSARFSPDGQLIVTASADRTARVWDARTGQLLTAPLEHGNRVTSAQFSCDGQRVVTVTEDEKVRLWDTRTGLLLTTPFLPDGLCPSDFPLPPMPVPVWVPELAEAVAGRRLNKTGAVEFTADTGLGQFQGMLLHSKSDDFYTLWGKWFFADPSQRKPSPFSE